MKKLTILLLFISFITKAQSVKNQILENLSEIKSVNPKDTNFSDLKKIGDAIGNSKIVFLGEQDHGDATAFEAKTRIIKYLHEKKGFNVLAFESDFFNINKKSDENKPIEEIEKSIFSVWSKCVQVNPLFSYIKNQQKKNPITISGFDCQIGQNLEEDRISFVSEMEKYIEKEIDVSTIDNYNLFRETLKDVIFFVKKTKKKDAYFKKVKKKTQKKFFQTLIEIKKGIKNKETFLFKNLENIESYAKMAWGNKEYRQGRDTQMGKNILWLVATKFPNEKIIFWAHSAHLVKGKSSINSYTKTSAGKYAIDRLNANEVYSIGFSSRVGFTDRVSLNTNIEGYKIINAQKEGFESWVYSKKLQYAFINFKALKNNSETFHMKGSSHYSYKNNWLTAFDGIFYIDEISPCIEEK
ncbi:erythromycin esterase family protein [Tenacibaculum aiptasiae]|uniref:erythromycin esterase family protein n=1 Tax=Tenacibaculum aiptasiae TaxID=426481 RepID=UPI003B5CE46A